MLSHPVEDNDLARLDPADYAAEWKWDGIRVQAVCEGGLRRLYSRTGDEISGAFPDLIEAMTFDGALDGELLVGDPPETHRHLLRPAAAPEPQERIAEDSRALSGVRALLRPAAGWRRGSARPAPHRTAPRLEAFVATLDPSRFDLSPITTFADWTALDEMRRHPPHPVIEGVMIKQQDPRPMSPADRKVRGSNGSATRIRSTRC